MKLLKKTSKKKDLQTEMEWPLTNLKEKPDDYLKNLSENLHQVQYYSSLITMYSLLDIVHDLLIFLESFGRAGAEEL